MILRFAFLIGIAAALVACNTDDEIADGTGGAAGQAGSSGQGGTTNQGGTAGTAGNAGTAGAAGSCSDACPAAGQTQCMGAHLIVCGASLNGCLAWQTGPACPVGQSCNADGTKCVSPSDQCASDADCGCGCGCGNGTCYCTGAIERVRSSHMGRSPQPRCGLRFILGGES